MHLHLTCFDGQTDAPVKYPMHLLMEGIQGLTQSHWMPSLGKYSCHNTPANNRVVYKKNDKNAPYLQAIFLAMAMHW